MSRSELLWFVLPILCAVIGGLIGFYWLPRLFL